MRNPFKDQDPSDWLDDIDPVYVNSSPALDEEKLELLKTDPDEFFRRYPRREISWMFSNGREHG